jgi:ribonuclease P protein subunit RPR2
VENQRELELSQEVERLRTELARRERQAAEHEHELALYAAELSETVRREQARTQQLRRSYLAMVRALSNAVEARDAYTARHAERVSAYGMAIAASVGGDFARTPDLEFGFLLHDIGKVAVPDAILYKPGVLTDEERALVARHPVIGEEIVSGIEFLDQAREVVRSHHERWDGRGYPDGLRGEEIPLAARVFAVADVLDALTTDRPYRTAMPLSEARAMIVAQAGRHFDPDVLHAFDTIDDEELEHAAAAAVA